MFQRLQQKWKVNGLQLLLILCTFAIGGSLTGFAGKKLMNVFSIEERWLWVVIYIISYYYTLAFFSFTGKFFFWTVPLFYRLSQENWKKNRDREEVRQRAIRQ